MHTFPDFRCPAEAMGLVGILFSLLAMWIALGRGRWWIRSAIGVAALGLLLPLHAYQPIVFFSLSGVSSVVLLSLLRFFSRRDQVRRRSRTAPPTWRRLTFWSGALAGLAVASACVGWAVRVSWNMGWMETLLVFLPVYFTIQIVAMLFGDSFRLGAIVVTRRDSVGQSFCLSDAMSAIVLLAILFMINMLAQQRDPVSQWSSMLSAAGIMTLATASIASLFLANRLRWRFVAIVVFSIVLGLAFQFGAVGGKWLMQASALSFLPGSPYHFMIWSYSATLLMTTLCVATAGWLRYRPLDSPAECSTRRLATIASWTLLTLYAVCLIPIAVQMARPLAQPVPIAGDATDYGRLETKMVELMTLNPKEQTVEALAKAGRFTNANKVAEAYASIRRSTRHVFRAPDPLAVDADFTGLGQKLNVFRSWARCMDKEAMVKVKAGEFSEASEAWRDCIHVGHGLGRGSHVSYALAGIATEGVGQEGLVRIRNDLPAEKLAELLPALIMIDGQRESLESLHRRSDLVMDREMTWQYRLAMHAPAHLSAQSQADTMTLVSPAIESTGDAIRRRDAGLRLLMVEFAARLFDAKQRRLPTSIEELVPEFLPAVPLDPFSGNSLIYRQTDSGYVVYSTGPNRTDDGGAFGDITALYQDGYDFDLDTLIRPTKPSGGVGFGGMN
ncbi:hypothetical protein [Planctomycetes bacterium TBK1r]|uniref:Type II secretion system protein GspG C-terminal domain-containing protein n=1 Tax=Stieleria magnilauensis TaxID=2527963 RepID=A0ABX5XSF1_9BACT|nr:hypothetical protein TBK1r_38800 [Planctomycetes bacterium TBK1r]